MSHSNPDRLPGQVVPFHYDVVIKTNVELKTFDGKAVIHLKVEEDSNTICLNAHKDLDLLGIVLQRAQGESLPFLMVNKEQIPEDDTPVAYLEGSDRLVLKLPSKETLTTGELGLRLHLSWCSKLRTDGRGYYLSNYGSPVDGKYSYFALTQLEAATARQVYPCWDEPSMKATFAFTMVTVNGLKCLSCMRETTSPRALQSQLALDFVEEGWQVVHFETTPPMSTYVTAIASGPFNCLEEAYVSPITGKTIPLATWATEDDCKHTAFALQTMKGSLAFFEELLQVPYPLPKLDMLAVPNFEMGAQENFGLITTRARECLTPPGVAYQVFDQAVNMICHEVSHMWFGNLVTSAWWDDLFLKEGFATWLGGLKCAQKLHPERYFSQSFVAQTVMCALASDSTRHTHAIIDEKAQTLEQLENTWDNICYEKGSSVVAMLAAYAGMEQFVKGIQRFLGKGYSVANREDLWRAMDNGNMDFVSFARKWISTSGYPVVKVEKAGKGYRLCQERFLSTGDLEADEDTEIWPIPLNIHVFGESRELPKLFSEKTMEIDLPADCLFKLNQDSLGVYRVCYPEDMIRRLSKLVAENDSGISAEDRIGLLDDCFQLAHAGYYPPSVPLEFVSAMKDEQEPWVLWRMHTLLSTYLGRWATHKKVADHVKGLLHQLFATKADELGFDANDDDLPMSPLAREVCMSGALLGNHKSAVAEAIRRFDLAVSSGSLDGILNDLLPVVLQKAVDVQGQPGIQALRKFYLSSSDDMTGQIIANALCSVSASKDQVLEALNWMMDNGLVQHLQEALVSASKGSLGDEVAIPWFIAQFELLEGKLTRYTMRRLVESQG